MKKDRLSRSFVLRLVFCFQELFELLRSLFAIGTHIEGSEVFREERSEEFLLFEEFIAGEFISFVEDYDERDLLFFQILIHVHVILCRGMTDIEDQDSQFQDFSAVEVAFHEITEVDEFLIRSLRIAVSRRIREASPLS